MLSAKGEKNFGFCEEDYSMNKYKNCKFNNINQLELKDRLKE